MAFCTNCGAKLLEGASFCTECGSKVEVIENVYQPAPAEQPTPVENPAEAPALQAAPEVTAVNSGKLSYADSWQTAPGQSGAYDPRMGAPGFTFQGAEKQKKSAAPFIVLGILGVLLVALIAVAGAMFASRSAKGNDVPSDSLGVYNGVSIQAAGLELPADGAWIELKTGGKATICLQDKEYSGKWSLDGENIVITQSGEEFSGTLHGGVLTMDLGGLEYTFAKEGAEISTAPSSGGSTTIFPDIVPVADDVSWWEGDWYGWWIVTEGTGEWAEFEDSCWDACARITAYDDETGSFMLWDEDSAEDECIINVEVSFRDGTTSVGTMMSEDGGFWDCAIGHADWVVDPGTHYGTGDFENMICIEGSYIDPQNRENTFDYMIFLRPWGMEWEDVRNGDTTDCPYDDMMPLMYDEWYLQQLRDGVTTAPDVIG